MSNTVRLKSWGRTAALGVLLGALSACGDLLEVELPHLLTDAALAGPETAETQVNSAIALFECGSSSFSYIVLGHEDVLQSVAGIGGGNALYRATPLTGGTCDGDSASGAWFDQMMGARAAISRDPALVNNSTGDDRGVYDRIQNEWSAQLGTDGVRLSAIAALYMAATLTHFGEFYCEFTLDGGDLLSPDAALVLADSWITTAQAHIASHGAFDMPFQDGVDAGTLATALRARALWARGPSQLAAAAAAAASIPDGFMSWITRETGEQRRNKIFHAAQEVKFAGIYGKIDWWQPTIRSPNPVTGASWPDPIPYTGYIFLALQADGRAVDAAGNAITWANETRDAGDNPVPLPGFTAANADTRVPTKFESVQGPGKFEVPNIYSAESDDIPWVTWGELRLIRAEAAAAAGDAAGAISHIDALRDAAGLPRVTYGPATTAELRAMVHEERRRQLFGHGGRYYAYKIQNPEFSWFPRLEGVTPYQSYGLQGGVRLLFDGGEYENNDNWAAAGGLAARGSGCPAAQAPVI